MSQFFSDLNPSLGAVQTDVYTGYVATLPVVENSLLMFANSIDLEPNQAQVHNIRKFEQLEIDGSSRVPISRRLLNDDRIQGVRGEVIPITSDYYGVSVVIDNAYKMNTKENIMSSTTRLFADWGSRIRETLLAEMLKGAGTIYTFSNGGTAGNTAEANIKDLTIAKSILDKNRVRRAQMQMIKATDQIGTNPVGQSFAAHVSLGGRTAWELAISDATEIVRPYQFPTISDQLYQNIFFVKRADTCLYSSTELVDNENDRIIILHGDEAYVVVGKSPLSSAVIVDPEYKSGFGMHTRVGYRLTHGQAIIRNDRIVNARFIDS